MDAVEVHNGSVSVLGDPCSAGCVWYRIAEDNRLIHIFFAQYDLESHVEKACQVW